MKNIILIAYYFTPYKGVGALRLSYWYDKLREDGLNVKVITATPQSYDNDRIDNDIISIGYNQNKYSCLDYSYRWGRVVKPIVDQLLNECENSIVIITGGPFLHIKNLIELKSKHKYSKWIIDYRDPLSNNPRNKKKGLLGFIRYTIKKMYESYINKESDIIITVNKVCKDIIIGSNQKIRLIDNGYDERYFLDSNQLKCSNKFIYAGQIYNGDIFNTFCLALKNKGNYFIEYFGPLEVKFDDSILTTHKTIPYSELSKILPNFEYGVLFTSGESFESTTKIFDYFAAKVKILIVTSGTIKTGVLHDITESNPNIEWAEDNKHSILQALQKLQRPYIEWDYSQYSRYEGYKKLKGIIENL